MASTTTHPSLLSRLRNAADGAAWTDFEARYSDLVLGFCLKRGLQFADAEDVRQIVFLKLARSLPHFRYSPERGRFRSYLGQIVRNAIIQHASRPNLADAMVDTDVLSTIPCKEASEADDAWLQEWIDHHLRLAMQTVRATFHPDSVAVFEELLAGRGVTDVAAARGLTIEAVYKIKQRVRNRLRELIDAQLREEEALGDDEASD